MQSSLTGSIQPQKTKLVGNIAAFPGHVCQTRMKGSAKLECQFSGPPITTKMHILWVRGRVWPKLALAPLQFVEPLPLWRPKLPLLRKVTFATGTSICVFSVKTQFRKSQRTAGKRDSYVVAWFLTLLLDTLGVTEGTAHQYKGMQTDSTNDAHVFCPTGICRVLVH